MSLQLLVTAGPDAGQAFTIQAGPDLTLGRGERSYYRLNDPRASRSHCQILLEGDQVTVIDNGSTGGTIVNGKKVAQKQALKLGDVLKIGDTELRLTMGDFPLDVALGAVNQAPPAKPGAPVPSGIEQLERLSGTTLAHYEVGHVIGRGRLGLTFHATDQKDGRPVALKVLLPEFSKDDQEVQRFVRAMKTAMPLRHPNLMAVYGAGKTGPHCWSAMEYVAGESMTEVIGRIGVAGMLDWKYAFRMAVHVGRALAYAHSQDIIHRNVTPNNVLREATTQTFKLGDLLRAKALEGSLVMQISRPGELVGDVDFMSPERTRGLSDIDGRADLYALGATAYALLTGRPPCPGETLVEKITKIRQTEPVKPCKFQMSVPNHFEGVVMKLLAKKPEDRYQTAEEVVKELERVGKMNGVTA